MTLGCYWAGTVGCPMKVGGLRTVGPSTVRVPGGTCRTAAGICDPPSRLYIRQSRRGFPSTASRLCCFYLVPSVGTSCRFWKLSLPRLSQRRSESQYDRPADFLLAKSWSASHNVLRQ